MLSLVRGSMRCQAAPAPSSSRPEAGCAARPWRTAARLNAPQPTAQLRMAHASSASWALKAIEEKREQSGAEASSAPERDVLSDAEIRKLAELRRQQRSPPPQQSGNVVQGALEEAQLISWPKPQKALLDTVLVLAIVSGTGVLLLGLNILLAELSTKWYSL